ncbi:MAG: phage integrase N-terminal SAM-like domain-containing protein [Phormidesmis sp. CAN_BIN36]|nr:phage integrase N-terminal SAM-like domain-containing protein [Phormidesmis sp. CAN_BIN36]
MKPKLKAIPEIQIIPVDRAQSNPQALPSDPRDLRELRIEEFLQARSLAPRTQKAYRQDFQQFLNWSDQAWAEITPRQIAQFKAHLMQTDLETAQRVLSDATVRRVLGTLKNFLGWMTRSRYRDLLILAAKPGRNNTTDESLVCVSFPAQCGRTAQL